ncbi:right-handed parallel beta-helix repeat-containing protein [Methanobrevibacter sp.]|uniref:right-handed parallel beta-helix repeat-containing protein n=1 Tax=Methanobrevibacter sp. TaxID=66852 RepID=UPI0025CBC07C|nr:right-handed parallel beta-helix repeat-containing protein [Methanobrevibacter sp.]MBR4447941.1 hypothetical protein [Methanobrevibacter sp.]
MLKKLLIILTILIFAVGVVSAEDASLANETLADAQPHNTGEIQNLINDANETDTINLNGTYKNENIVQLEINKSITIDGGADKTVIDADGQIFHINIESGTVALKNLRITNANSQGFNPDILSNHANLILVNCSFEHILGANIIQSSGNLTLENCEFINNEVTNSIICTEKTSNENIMLSQKNSKMINNTAKSLFLILQTKNAIITNNILTDNNISGNIIKYYDEGVEYSKLNRKNYNNINISANVMVNKNHPKIYFSLPYATNPKNGMITFACNLEMKDNFYGFNIQDSKEFSILPVFEFEVNYLDWLDTAGGSSVNLRQIGKTGDNYTYELYFTNDKQKEVNLNYYSFSIKNKTNGKLIVSNIQNRTFTLNEDIDPSGVYIISSIGETVNKDPANITYTIEGKHYMDMKIKIRLENGSQPLANQLVRIDIVSPYGKGVSLQHDTFRTDENGYVIFEWFTTYDKEISTYFDETQEYYNITVTFSSYNFGSSQKSYSYLKINKIPITIDAGNVAFDYGKQPTVKYSVSYTDSKKAADDLLTEAKIYKGKKLIKTLYARSSMGACSIKMPKLDAGSYTLKIMHLESFYENTVKTVKLTVNKVKTTVKAPKVTYNFKKSKYFKITVKNKKTKKPIKVLLKVKIGKKTYKLKTNAKGIVKFNTKKLKVGKHKVKISSGNTNYQISAKSKITIKR